MVGREVLSVSFASPMREQQRIPPGLALLLSLIFQHGLSLCGHYYGLEAMAKKLKYKKLGPDPVWEDDYYKCGICKLTIPEPLLEEHTIEHKRNSYQIDIDIKKEKTDGTSLFRSV